MASTLNAGRKYPLFVRLREDSVTPGWLVRHSLSKERMDDALLAEAILMFSVDPNRSMA